MSAPLGQPADSLIVATIEDLTRHAPFDAMEAEPLRFLATRLVLRYYARGSVVLRPADGEVQRLYILQKGEISGAEETKADATARETGFALTLSEGECFPIGALISRRATTLTFTAAEDSFCYELKREDFEQLMDRSRAFRDFATRRIAALFEQSRRAVQSDYTARVSDATSLMTPLKSMVRRAPETVLPSASIRSVLEKMKALRIGSVVIADEHKRAVGIFTERDVLDRVALGNVAHDEAIAAVMTPEPFSLPASAPLFEAAQAMARHRFRHVLLMEEGALVGVVSERDLFSMQRLSLGEIAKAIEHAADAASLARAAQDVRKLAIALLAQGVAAEQLTQFVTTLNDAVVERALKLAAQEAPPPAVPWCWLGLGSEGRMEQTLATDQDNALLFVASSGDGDSIRTDFLAFATVANGILDMAGFPLCKGDIMAKNPRWCLNAAEWRTTFEDWIRAGNPQALLNAAIFFDFRPLAGEIGLAHALRQWLTETIQGQPLFLRHMAANALQVRPPLGVLRDFVADDDRYPGTIDLKKVGSRPFVDAARIFALQNGITATNTAERIRRVAPRLRMSDDEAGAIVDGFHFVQLLRLRNQETADASDVNARPPNRIDPETLNELDRRILKEALRQARKLQSRLEMDFRL
jgi:CBS domain-containing protein